MLDNPYDFYEVSWKISNRCNLNCPYCVNHHKENDNPRVFETASRINELISLRKQEGSQIYITGGEPYLQPINDLIPLFTSEYLHMVRITSNLTLPVEEYLKTRELLEKNDREYLLKASFHLEKESDEAKHRWIDRCFEAKADFINLVVNDDNYCDYLILLQDYDFDGDALIYSKGHEIRINWMVERISGGGVSNKVKCIPRSSRSFEKTGSSVKCSAGWNTVRIEPNGDIKRCFKTPVEGNILTDPLEAFLWPSMFNCVEEKCPGCQNVFIYDKSEIHFHHMVPHDTVDVGG